MLLPKNSCKQSNLYNNFAAILLWDLLWCVGSPFCMYITVVPAYLLLLGASKTTIQIVSVVLPILNLIQLFSTIIIKRKNRKNLMVIVWIIYGPSWLLYGVVAYFLFDKYLFNNVIWIILFVFTTVVLNLSSQLGGPLLKGMVLENIPLQRRGLLASLRSLAYGVGGIIGTIYVFKMMNSYPLPTNYHLSFIVGGFFYFLSTIIFWLIFKDYKEYSNYIYLDTKESVTDKKINQHKNDDYNNYDNYWKDFKRMLKDKNFVKFLIAYFFLVIPQYFAPLLIVYSYEQLNISQNATVNFTAVYFISSILIGATLPVLADRFGFKIIATISALMISVAFFIPSLQIINSQLNQNSILFCYGLYCGASQLTTILVDNLGTEIANYLTPTKVIVLSSIALIPLVLIFAPMGGVLADQIKGTNGYLIVFIFAFLIALISSFIFIFKVKDPRF